MLPDPQFPVRLVTFTEEFLMENFIFCAVMFGRAMWDKLFECIFEMFEIARVKRD